MKTTNWEPRKGKVKWKNPPVSELVQTVGESRYEMVRNCKKHKEVPKAMANRINKGSKWQAKDKTRQGWPIAVSGVFFFTAAILMASGPCLPQLCTDERNVLPTSCLGGKLPDVSSPISSRDVSVTEAANLEERTTEALDGSKKQA